MMNHEQNWSGFMQQTFTSCHASVCRSVVLLPIIDLSPSDECCMYSTLIYIEKLATLLNIPSPCITFDQPLWIKAVEIINAKSLNIVCKLGGFHTMMSFMGSIGSMMKGSGLEEVLETVYGPNTVTHMISGKAVSRALRGHLLVEAALTNKLMEAVLPFQDDHEDTNDDHEKRTHLAPEIDMLKLDDSEVQKIHDLYQGIQDKSLTVYDIAESKELIKLEECLQKHKHKQPSCGCNIWSMWTH